MCFEIGVKGQRKYDLISEQMIIQSSRIYLLVLVD